MSTLAGENEDRGRKIAHIGSILRDAVRTAKATPKVCKVEPIGERDVQTGEGTGGTIRLVFACAVPSIPCQ